MDDAERPTGSGYFPDWLAGTSEEEISPHVPGMCDFLLTLQAPYYLLVCVI